MLIIFTLIHKLSSVGSKYKNNSLLTIVPNMYATMTNSAIIIPQVFTKGCFLKYVPPNI